MHGVTTKKALKYVILPGITPRIRQLFGSGFGSLALLMGQLYALVGLLPKHHPYNNPQNLGRFGIRHVIAEAANNLVLSRKNIDKILIFAAILTGALLLVLQIVMLIYMLVIEQAWAITVPFVNFLDTANADTDLAYEILVQVFGVPDFFCSAIAAGVCPPSNGLVPNPFHSGLQDLFAFYSVGLLLIGMLIFLYFIVVIVAESAATGSPFGQRFKNVWVPIRLIVAIGLLIPLNFGYNSGQYITLFSAKLGSSLGTNGWLAYNNAIAAHPLFAGGGANPSGELETLVGMPKEQTIEEVIEFMSLVHTCAYTYWRYDDRSISGAVIPDTINYRDPDAKIQMYFAKTDPGGGAVPQLAAGAPLVDALNFYNDGNIHIIFGHENNEYKDKGGVAPFCGEIVIPVNHVPFTGAGGTPTAADQILEAYYNLVQQLWDPGSSNVLNAGAVSFTEVVNAEPTRERMCNLVRGNLPNPAQCEFNEPGDLWKDNLRNTWQPGINTALVNAWIQYVQQDAEIEIETDVLERGWAGAGIWFNRIARLNGNFMDSVLNIPRVKEYPMVMEETRQQKLQADASLTGADLFNPVLEGDNEVYLGDPNERKRAKVLHRVYAAWNGDQQSSTPDRELINNVFIDAMSMILGIEGVFDIRGENAPTHPLSQLVMVGKGLVESTIRNLAVATASSFLGGIMSSAGSAASASILNSISSFFTSTAFLGLTAGIVLFYIVPFLPFLYFFFAVGTWVKSIFEAMVGVPLWALAHLRIDGEGLPGDSASNGYFLILEIFIRPILIVFGLVAAMTIFTAQVRVLHFIWDLVVQNTGGYTVNPLLAVNAPELAERTAYERGIVDQFFFTVIYTIIVYMLATASFKLIDMIPNNILRWIGSSATSFGDQNSDAGNVDQLGRYVAVSGMVQGQELAGAIPGLGGAAGRAGGAALGLGGSRTPPAITPNTPS